MPSPQQGARPSRIGALIHHLRETLFNVSFWLGLTMGFPLEHFLWEKIWPFRVISAWLGLVSH
jgi:hypothetical protein